MGPSIQPGSRHTLLRITAGLALANLAIHLICNGRYGYFVDELYYLACSEHLDWGYVDQPPLIAAIAWVARRVLGDSLQAVRFFPAVASAAKVFLTGILVREFGGGHRAAILACVGIIVAPGFQLMDTILTMNVFEPLFWMGCALLMVRMVKTGNTNLWLWFGLVAGIGLLNKHSMLLFGFAAVMGLLLTSQRRLLASRWLWVGGAIAFLIFLPNLIWNFRHEWPFFELQRNIRESGRNVSLNPISFVAQQVLFLNVLAAPIWLGGLWHLLRRPAGRQFRFLGWTYLLILALLLLLAGRVYYLLPAYPMLFAAGGVFLEEWFARLRRAWLAPAYVTLMVAVAAVLVPFFLPVLPVEKYVAFSQALHFSPPRIERHRMGPLPQWWADMHGWKEMAESVAQAYDKLPADDRARCGIFGQNYGQAGAVDFFGPALGLPKAISAHQNYYFWGPREYTGECLMVMDDTPESLGRFFNSVKKVATVYHPYSMPYQHFDVYLCREPRPGLTLRGIWPQIKRWN